MVAPDFLVIGHVAKDVNPDGWRLGGTVTYAATQAARLGLRAAVLTRASADLEVERLLPDIDVRCLPSETSTSFENRYVEGRRIQHVGSRAPAITAADVPQGLRGVKMVLLGPLLDEVAPDMATLFPDAIVGYCAQGLLREVRRDGLVVRRPWPETGSMKGISLIAASEEDIEGDGEVLERWQRDVPLVTLTCGRGGARVFADARWRDIGAFPHEEVDPTGAGDVFAAAFVIALSESGDVARAARFATAAAGLSVEAPGIERIAARDEIERVLATHPGVALE